MHLVYVDDSKGDRTVCFSAIAIPVTSWNDALNHLIRLRREMFATDGIYITKELHATDWLGGRGNVARSFVPKGARARLFKFMMGGIADLPNVQIFNACCHKSQEELVFERLLNRIHRNMQAHDSHALIISDEGKNYDNMLRRLRRVNFVQFRGRPARNDPLDRIVEDISYRDSQRSYFIQAADFCAFSLLRHKHPTRTIQKYALQDAFRLLDNVLVRKANYADPLGIIYA